MAEAQGATEGQLDELRWRRSMTALWAAQFIALSGMSLVNPFLPYYIQDELHVSGSAVDRWAGLLQSVNFLMAALMAPLWGRLADQVGRKLMLVRAFFGLSVTVGAMGLCHNVYQLLFLRALQGSIGGSVAAAMALVGASAPRESVGRSLGALQTAIWSGAVIGPLLGGTLADAIGMRRAFLGTGIACVVGGMLVWLFVKERMPDGTQEQMGFLATMRGLLANPGLRVVFVALLLSQVGVTVIQPILPLFLKTLGVEPTHLKKLAGLLFSSVALTGVVMTPFWGKRADERGPQSVMPLALFLAGLIYLPAALAQSYWQLLLLRMAFGGMMCGVQIASRSAAVHLSPEGQEAQAMGLLSTGQMMGQVVGPLIGGNLSASLGSVRPVFVVSSVALLLGAWRAWRLRAELGRPAAVGGAT